MADPRRAEIARAILAVRRGAPDDALSILRSVVIRHPGDARARRLLAQVLALEDRLPEAVQELEEAHGLLPDDGETTYALATAYLRRAGEDGPGAADDLARAATSFQALMDARPSAATAVLIGRSYLDYRHHDEAREWLERARALDPGAVRSSYYLGKVVLSTTGYEGLEEAAGHFRRELEVQPEDPLSSLYLGLALTELRRCDEAVPALERATANPLTALDAYRFLGKCHLAEATPEGDRKARVELERALEIASHSGRTRQLESVHYQLGVALRRLGDPAAAEHFEAAERLSGHLVDADRANLDTYLSEGLVTEPPAELLPLAIEGLEALAALGPERRAALRPRLDRDAARAYANLGTLAARDGRPVPATRLFKAAAALDPALDGLDRNLGLTAFQARRWEVAAEALERVLRSAPDDLEALRALALTEVNRERYDAAADLLATDPDRASDPSLQYAYALSLVRSGRDSEAAEAFERLFREHPDWPELHVLLGQAKAQQGDFPGAVETLEHALELRSDVADAHFTLGEIRMRQGELDAAIAAFEAELAVHPGALPARYQLAVALDLAEPLGRRLAPARRGAPPAPRLRRRPLPPGQDPARPGPGRGGEEPPAGRRLGGAGGPEHPLPARPRPPAPRRDRRGEGRARALPGAEGGGAGGDAVRVAAVLLLVVLAAAPALAQGDPPAALRAAVAELEAGRPAQAEAGLRAHLAERPDDPLAHDLLGVVLGRLGRAEEAASHFTRAIDGGLTAARGHLARLHLLQGREAEALDQLRRAAAEDPAALERDLALKLAVAELAEGREESAGRAEALLRSVIERHDSAQALLLLARLQLSRGETGAALGALDRAKTLAPNAREVLDADARAAFDADDLPRALTALDALARMHPEVPEYPYRLGLAQMRAGDVQSAVAALEHARGSIRPGSRSTSPSASPRTPRAASTRPARRSRAPCATSRRTSSPWEGCPRASSASTGSTKPSASPGALWRPTRTRPRPT